MQIGGAYWRHLVNTIEPHVALSNYFDYLDRCASWWCRTHSNLYPIYTMQPVVQLAVQPAVQPVVQQPVGQPVVSCKRGIRVSISHTPFIRLWRFDDNVCGHSDFQAGNMPKTVKTLWSQSINQSILKWPKCINRCKDHSTNINNMNNTRMWEDAHRDGRPALLNIGGALCSTPRSLADAH